ncbi:MAG TPA: FAD-dependent thymidylate synthase [bacterium]|nr:FAD-dependent thymidylate synthase [bacterium]HMW37281.1 FAD-dependent thymidylate synthase [bacterium]HMY37161.1 FAD-dependent thymidylate synthase [bacterium]HMZ05825.1 FAD-dependent thymidylate synthase [bacterium]HNB56796.1 FAD-dependent thymidylate synthase [bacterium]
MHTFLSPKPHVVLSKSFSTPFQNAIATARTCYSAKGIVRDEQITDKHVPLAQSVYQAGHHTVFSHAYFQFELANVSRQFLWTFLHSHPFYNSEQVSQRYVEVKPDTFLIPALEGEALAIYREAIAFQTAAYFKLNEMLRPSAEAAYFKRFPARAKVREKYAKEIQKKCQEISRYVLPVAAFSYLYHTVSGITLLRYYRLCNQMDTPVEQRVVVEQMVQEMIRLDPMYKAILEEALPIEETPEYLFYQAHPDFYDDAGRKAFAAEFDRSLDGRMSKLVDYKINNEAVVAQSVREVLGLTRERLSDADAIALALDPSKNKLYGESLNLTTMSKITRALVHAHYTFRKKISHAADSQDQRHRMTPGSRPILTAHRLAEPDYITPALILEDANVHAYYDEVMTRTWEYIARLRAHHVSDENAMYLLPNAVAIRFTESADLQNLHHKMAMRLCYLAQEEIWRASVDETQQIQQVNPVIGNLLLPPCGIRLRAGMRPYCPEGDRFCGERVWTMTLDQYQRVI